MNTWEERIQTSEALLKARELKELATTTQISDITNEQQDCMDRAEAVAEAAISRLNDCDPRLINPSALANLGSALTNSVSHFNSWVSTGSEAYLTQSLQSELDSALNFIVALAPSQTLPEAQAAVTSLRRSVGRHRAVVENVITELEQRGSAADVTIDEKLKEATDEFAKLQTKVTELDTDLTSIKSSSAQVTTEQQTAFTKAEADRSATFNKLVTDKQKELETSLETLGTTAEQSVQTIRQNVEKDKKQAETAKTRVEEILGIVSEEALIGDYAQNAKDEQKAANQWRLITAGSIVGAIVAAIVFATTVNDTTNWQHVVSKIVIVLTFGGLAGYAGKQSSEHRTAQRDAERMALQLKALKPYLNDIDNSGERDKLLIAIADRLFGQEPSPILNVGKVGKKNDNPVLTMQLLEALIDILKRDKNL